jgi:hypothetical protein
VPASGSNLGVRIWTVRPERADACRHPCHDDYVPFRCSRASADLASALGPKGTTVVEHETAEADPTWMHVVDRLRRENEGLRAAMRSRAVIEQAKGVLMARSGSDPETAFRHLVDHSQRMNLKLTQVAAAVVARTMGTPPVATGPSLSEGELLEAATGDIATRFLTAAAIVSAPDLDELLRTVIQHTKQFGVVAGSLALAEPDGALRLAGVHGAEVRAVSAWRRMPPGTDLPMVATAASRTPSWFEDADERERRFPGSVRYPGHRDAGAVLPLLVDRQLVGVLSLDWHGTYRFDEEARSHLTEVAALCSAPIADLLRRYDEPLPGVEFEPGYAGWFRSFLDSVPAATVLLEPESDGDRLVDLHVLFIDHDARRKGSPLRVGTSLFESLPALVTGAFIERAETVLVTGEPQRLSEVSFAQGDEGRRTTLRDVSVFRVGTLLAVSWRHASS